MRIKNLANRLISLETVLVPPVAEPTVIILNAVDSNGVTVSTQEIIVNRQPASAIRPGGHRRY